MKIRNCGWHYSPALPLIKWIWLSTGNCQAAKILSALFIITNHINKLDLEFDCDSFEWLQVLFSLSHALLCNAVEQLWIKKHQAPIFTNNQQSIYYCNELTMNWRNRHVRSLLHSVDSSIPIAPPFFHSILQHQCQLIIDMVSPVTWATS